MLAKMRVLPTSQNEKLNFQIEKPQAGEFWDIMLLYESWSILIAHTQNNGLALELVAMPANENSLFFLVTILSLGAQYFKLCCNIV